MKVSVVVPVYNEMRTLPRVFEALSALALDKEVIAVDDGSADGSGAWLEDAAAAGRFPFPLRVIRHRRNHGKGRALINGFAAASGDIVIVQDADLEYAPSYIPAVIAPIAEGRADAVYGSRILSGRSRLYSRLYLWGNLFMTFLVNSLFGAGMTDAYTGCKAFRRGVLEGMRLSSDGFEIEAELSCLLAFKKVRYAEVAIEAQARSRAEGKKIGFQDAVKGALKVLRMRLALGGAEK